MMAAVLQAIGSAFLATQQRRRLAWRAEVLERAVCCSGCQGLWNSLSKAGENAAESTECSVLAMLQARIVFMTTAVITYKSYEI